MGIQFVSVSAPEKGGYNEDAAVTRLSNGILIATVADAHAETGADPEETATFARFVAEHTADAMERGAEAIPTEFDRVAALVRDRKFDPRIGAVVGCVAMRESERELVVAHAGDARLYASVRRPRVHSFLRDSRPGFRLFTRDHVPSNTVEDERLRPFVRSGAFRIETDAMTSLGWGGEMGTQRLYFVKNGKRAPFGLAPTRGFGDTDYQPAFSHVPGVQTIRLAGELEHAVFGLCSDGAPRNVGRTFAHFERTGVPNTLDPFAETFLAFHEGRMTGVSSRADDDGTAIFFRMV